MGRADYYASGQWNFICDQCGAKRKSKEMREQWDGLVVCKRCYDPRHPQDFVRGTEDDQTVPVNRPDTEETFTATATSLTPDTGGTL